MGSDTAREVAHKFIADGSDWCHFSAATGHSAACDRLTLRIEMAYGTDDENDKSLAEVNATLESERSRTAALEGALRAIEHGDGDPQHIAHKALVAAGLMEPDEFDAEPLATLEGT